MASAWAASVRSIDSCAICSACGLRSGDMGSGQSSAARARWALAPGWRRTMTRPDLAGEPACLARLPMCRWLVRFGGSSNPGDASPLVQSPPGPRARADPLMLPPVVVDLGPEVGRPQLEIVLEACNEAIARGVCVPEGAGGEEAPRALAVARAADRTVRVVRIEVRLPGDDGASFVRELRFARRDPVSERWRTVGLAIATLVGEGEQRAREEDADTSAPSAEPAPEAEPAQPAPPAVEPSTAAPSTA